MITITAHIIKDRDWSWYCGPKPPEDGRAYLKAQGFKFSAKGHRMKDGRVGHWYLKPGAQAAKPATVEKRIAPPPSDRIDIAAAMMAPKVNVSELDAILAL